MKLTLAALWLCLVFSSLEQAPAWQLLDRISILLALGAPILWLLNKVKNLIRERGEDHARITALWREHGYGDWNGIERRKVEHGPERKTDVVCDRRINPVLDSGPSGTV